MNYQLFITTLTLSLITLSASATPSQKPIRATDMSPKIWDQYEQGKIQELNIEFREGDKLPINLDAGGDLFEITEANPSYITISKNFWIRLKAQKTFISLDGTQYKPFRDVLNGTLTIGAGTSNQNGGGIANLINISLKAHLKNE